MIRPLHHPKRSSKGFTLIELTLAMILGLMVAAMTLALFNQQLAFIAILKNQRFMIREAPQINGILNSLISRADKLNVVDANTLQLTFVNPSDETTTEATIAFDSGDGILSYQNTGGSTWNISTQLNAIEFDAASEFDVDEDGSFDDRLDETGILRIRLTGPNGGEIYYSTSPL